MPRKVATLTLDQASPVSGEVTFSASADGFKNEYLLWVSVHCFDEEDVPLSAEFLPIQWPKGDVGPFTASGTRGEAFMFEYPATATPINGTQVEFDVH